MLLPLKLSAAVSLRELHHSGEEVGVDCMEGVCGGADAEKGNSFSP